MAKATKKTPETAEAAAETSEQPAAAAAQQQAQRGGQVEVSDVDVLSLYANFCRVSGTPEELIVDFGLNPQPMGVPQKPIQLTQRIVLNYYTAKRLLAALSMSIQRHEAAFGILETDVQKRVQARAQS